MRAAPKAESSIFVGSAMMYFENWLMITMMALYPEDLGSGPMRSTDICSHGVLGIVFGCKGV